MTETPEIRNKRIRYRAEHRGFKEADILIGGFARDYLDALSDAERVAFEVLIELNDHDIYAWIMGAKPVPADVDAGLIQKMSRYAAESASDLS